MIRFNIIGTGFLDFEDGGGLAFKSQNQHFRFCDISLGRSVEFTIPATDRNRALLDYGEDPAMYGEKLRKNYPTQMVYDGGAMMGTLSVTAYQGNAFKCAFYMGGSSWVDRLQNLSLSDCVTSFQKGILWDVGNIPVNANAADPSEICQLLLYDNGMAIDPGDWQLVPSVNVATFTQDILTNLGVPFTSSLPHNYWMVAGSMRGGLEDDVTFSVTATNSASLTQSQGYFSVVDIEVEWARFILFGAWFGGGSVTAKGFKATQDVEVVFPASVQKPLFLVRWDSRLKACEVLGGAAAAGNVAGIEPLDGRTIIIKKGQTVFFASSAYNNIDVNGTYWGWKDIAYPVSIATKVERDKDLAIGEVWQLRCNMPDMTVFEFLRSVALATGMELTIDPDDGVTLAPGSYGQPTEFVEVKDVVSLDSVERIVEMWGTDTVRAVVDFDSEDYVTERLSAQYLIDNEQRQETETHTAKFSEGNTGTNGVVIEDVDVSSSPTKFKGKKWTLAWADDNENYLQRITAPGPSGYSDIANDSTCIRMKVVADEEAFFSLKPSTTFLWRGCAYIWTDADWSAGVMGLTLQKVSQWAYQYVPI